jgi:hypothetical protein
MLDVLSPVQLGGKGGVVGVTGQKGIRLENHLQSFRRGGPVADLGEMLEVIGNLAFVPGEEDGFHVGEVFVESRAADTGFFGNAGHGDPGEPSLGDKLGCGGDGGLTHRAAVVLNSVVPQLWHRLIIRYDACVTHCLV